MNHERGFLAFLLGNPMVLLSAALGIALVAAGIGLKFYKSRAEHWHAEAEAIQARFDGFVLEAKRLGDEQNAKTKAKEESDRAIFVKTVEVLKSDVARRDAAIKRLRDAPISRPDSSIVPQAACGPERPDGTREQFVPVAEYRALQERSYDDALRLTRLQEWVRETGHQVQ